MSPIDLMIIPVLLISLTVHEYSHALMAHLLGDDTAKSQGRLTLNPLKHLDPVGVVFFYFMHFGWAKPVPVDTRNLRDPHRDMLFIAAAGPASNLTLALFFGLILSLMSPWDQFTAETPQSQILAFYFLRQAIFSNVALAIFNMLPVFPLDGSSVLKGLLPRRAAMKLGELDKYCGIGLLAVFLLDQFAGTNILRTILGLPIEFVVKFIIQDVFPISFNTLSD